MPSGSDALRAEFGPAVHTLQDALAAGDDSLFLATLDDIVQRRKHVLFSDLRKLTGDLQAALERFRIDSRLVDLAEKEVPGARLRLDHVLKLTDEAAHKTMDLVEKSGPLAAAAAGASSSIGARWQEFRSRQRTLVEFRDLFEDLDAFFPATQAGMETVRANLSEVLLAQGYQDLSGQIIRGVMRLVSEVEVALNNLVRLADRGTMSPASPGPPSGYGPNVPGIDHGDTVSGQKDVDALLSGLGM